MRPFLSLRLCGSRINNALPLNGASQQCLLNPSSAGLQKTANPVLPAPTMEQFYCTLHESILTCHSNSIHMHIRYFLLVLLAITLTAPAVNAQDNTSELWSNKAFALYKDSVVQHQFTGKALSATQLSSNYKSPANEFVSPEITFKFSINGKDNEMTSGTDHHFTCMSADGACKTPLLKFGQQYKDNRAAPDNTYLHPQTQFHLQLDMRDVLAAFDKDGFYTTFNGNKIYKQDFKGVYVAGNTPPLIWDFDNLVNHPELQLHDDNNDGIYETTLTLNDQKNEKQTDATWTLSKDISAFPQYHSDYPISDALYNLALCRNDQCRRARQHLSEPVKNGQVCGRATSATASYCLWRTCNHR